MLKDRVEEIEREVATRLVSKRMKTLSFSDGYALGLIAKNPDDDWTEIQAHLGVDAQKIAKQLISPNPRTSREVKSAAQDLMDLARRVANSSSI